MTRNKKIIVPHGTVTGYTRYGCRQPCCAEPHREYRRAQAARRYAKIKTARVLTNGKKP